MVKDFLLLRHISNEYFLNKLDVLCAKKINLAF